MKGFGKSWCVMPTKTRMNLYVKCF